MLAAWIEAAGFHDELKERKWELADFFFGGNKVFRTILARPLWGTYLPLSFPPAHSDDGFGRLSFHIHTYMQEQLKEQLDRDRPRTKKRKLSRRAHVASFDRQPRPTNLKVVSLRRATTAVQRAVRAATRISFTAGSLCTSQVFEQAIALDVGSATRAQNTCSLAKQGARRLKKATGIVSKAPIVSFPTFRQASYTHDRSSQLQKHHGFSACAWPVSMGILVSSQPLHHSSIAKRVEVL